MAKLFRFHFQVKNKSRAVLLSKIQKFVLPGTTIISDALASYKGLSDIGYKHHFVIHKKAFVKSEDKNVHTQNIEVRNRWTKNGIKSYSSDRRLNSYCLDYSYR